MFAKVEHSNDNNNNTSVELELYTAWQQSLSLVLQFLVQQSFRQNKGFP